MSACRRAGALTAANYRWDPDGADQAVSGADLADRARPKQTKGAR